MLASIVTHKTVQDVKPVKLLHGDVIFDDTSRKCAVDMSGSALRLVKPRSGASHSTKPYRLPKAGTVRVLGRVEGGWSKLETPKATPKATTAKAAAPAKTKPAPKATPKAMAATKVAATAVTKPAPTAKVATPGRRESAVADVLDSIAALLRSE